MATEDGVNGDDGVVVHAEYLAAGGNRHPSASDWDGESGVLAFGADRNVAVWRPESADCRGVHELLQSHTDTVNAVKFVSSVKGLLISGSADGQIKLWKKLEHSEKYECTQTISEHKASINCLAVPDVGRIFASGAADGTVKVWSLDENNVAQLLQSIVITPRLFPLALALTSLPGAPGSYILAVGGTKEIVQLYVSDSESPSKEFQLQATLAGHEGWIRSLDFTSEKKTADSDLLLASASQDKYIRLWRIHQGKELPAAAASADPSLGAFMPGKTLSNKAHRFKAQNLDFSATFEALLFGHEDWIYSSRWRVGGNKLQLLSASADNSLAIWEPDPASGIWVTIARLGEISAEKGSTTATGSTGGFWTGLWSPSGDTVVCLGRTGSWRRWTFNKEQDRWNQAVGISGHTQSITGIAWSKGGDYILSTSSDQTTRLHAAWKRSSKETWHEMARPQIHGYDLNCIDTLGESQFVSGADEKLLRVFKEPKAVANLLYQLCGIGSPVDEADIPDAANMPVLGLSNKAIEAVEDNEEISSGYHGINNSNDRDAIDPASIVHKSTLNLDHPPFEEHLSRYTLWPEVEKLYGHGYEISTLAASHDGSLVATACKATSIYHAVIRNYDTKEWHEMKPPLTAHSLTVTRLRFSADDKYLVSVGRDRQWAIFQRDNTNKYSYTMAESNPKGHSRMILDAAWAPTSFPVFATAGRDKTVKLWAKVPDGSADGFSCVKTIPEENPVTAISFLNVAINDDIIYLAVGTESGRVKIYSISAKSEYLVTGNETLDKRNYLDTSKAVTQLTWKPAREAKDGKLDMTIAIASEDCTLRIYTLHGL
ncbi:WD40-repeat-containing domain protein [Xylogone sp. PMI_703]|nr:WD40-repeat-containing domain protein [Xylogone sp. PMI_703]